MTLKQERNKRYKQSQSYKDWQKAQALERKLWLAAVKTAYGCMNPKCEWHGEFEPFMLDFHHQNASDKKFQIGAKAKSRKLTIAEINKCIVLCANCHRLEIYGGLDVSLIEKCKLDEGGKPIY